MTAYSLKRVVKIKVQQVQFLEMMKIISMKEKLDHLLED